MTTSTSVIVPDPTTASAVIRYETTRNAEVYSQYIKANAVTAENYKDHALAVAKIKHPGIKPSSRADHATKEYKSHVLRCAVRAGLARNLDLAAAASPAATTKYATALALKDESLEAALTKFKAEWNAAHNKSDGSF